jgi:hypothetical protein
VDKTEVIWLDTGGLLRKLVTSDVSMNNGFCTLKLSDSVARLDTGDACLGSKCWLLLLSSSDSLRAAMPR